VALAAMWAAAVEAVVALVEPARAAVAGEAASRGAVEVQLSTRPSTSRRRTRGEEIAAA
jgi:hypothetical protein